jgi:hypothetical protein
VPREWLPTSLVCDDCGCEFDEDRDECPDCGSFDAQVVETADAGRFWGSTAACPCGRSTGRHARDRHLGWPHHAPRVDPSNSRNGSCASGSSRTPGAFDTGRPQCASDFSPTSMGSQRSTAGLRSPPIWPATSAHCDHEGQIGVSRTCAPQAGPRRMTSLIVPESEEELRTYRRTSRGPGGSCSYGAGNRRGDHREPGRLTCPPTRSVTRAPR